MITVVVGPLAIASLLLAVNFGATLRDCAPRWHDEVWYFNEIAVFHAAGWNGGYTIANEIPARAPFIHFGPHGPFFPALLGTLTRLTGLHLWSIPMLNAGLLMLASAAWLMSTRPTTSQAWTAAFIAMTFWPMVLYLPTSMQEALHYSIAFALAAASQWLLRNPRDTAARLVSLGLVVAAAQIRVTWCWVAVPLLWVAFQPRSWKGKLALGAGAAALVGALYGEAILVYAPFPNFMHDVLHSAAESPWSAMAMIFLHALKSVGHYLAPTRDNLVQVALRYQTLLIAGAAGYHVWARVRRERQLGVPATSSDQVAIPNTSNSKWELPRMIAGRQISAVDLAFGFVLLNLLCILGFVNAFYDVFDWRDYRVIAPHLLLSVLVLVGVGARQWLGGYAAIAVLVGLMVPTQFVRFHRERVAVDRTEIAAFANEIEDFVVVEPGASGWDNTILLHIDRLGSPLIAGLPPGIGAAPIYEREEGIFPARSKYVLLTPEEAVQFGAPDSLRKVATTALGDLYVQDAAPSHQQVGSASADAARATSVSASAEADSTKDRRIR